MVAEELVTAKAERDEAILSAAAIGAKRDEAVARGDKARKQLLDALAACSDLRQKLHKHIEAEAAKVAATTVEEPRQIDTTATADLAAHIEERKNATLARTAVERAPTARPGLTEVASTVVLLRKKRRSDDLACDVPIKRRRKNGVTPATFPIAIAPDVPVEALVPMPSPLVVEASPIVAFYRNGGIASNHGRGGCGLTLDRILGQSDAWLEGTHNFIQWLFPLQDKSEAVHDAPVLTTDDVRELRAVLDQVQTKVLMALAVMIAFYGLQVEEQVTGISIGKADRFDPRARWLRPGDHNSRRLSRMISSLRIFDLHEHANALRDCLRDLLELQGHSSQWFWQQA